MVAILGDVAGQEAAREATGKAVTTSDLSIHYLLQGKVGPFRTRAKVLRTTDESAVTRVEVMDGGVDDSLIAVVVNTAALDTPAGRPSSTDVDSSL
jgi:acyl-coenzyme A thioesterase PaaI-like protein